MPRNVALCYARLSNRGKQEVSIDLQKNRCALECERLGLVPVFYEEGLGKHSANSRKRLPEWDKLMQRALADESVFCVMSYDHERSFRNVQAARAAADKLNKAGVKLIFTTTGEVDTHTASGKMIFTIQSAFAEHYSNYVSEKLKDHFDELKAKGVYAGHRAPYGLKRVGKAPDVSFETTPRLSVILEWFNLYTTQDIGTPNGAAVLNQRGLRWHDRHGKPRPVVTDDLVQSLNAIDHYRPFIPPALYRAVKRTIAARASRQSNSAALVHPPLLLRGLLSCALCGAGYVCSNQTDRYGHLHGYYRHKKGTGCPNIVKPSARKVDALVWERVRLIHWSDEFKQAIVDALTAPPDTSAALDTKLTREKLTRKLENLKQMLANEDITRAEFLLWRKETQEQLDALPALETPTADALTADEAWSLVNDLAASLANPELGTPYSKNKAMGLVFQRVTIEGRRGDYRLDFELSPLFEDVLVLG